MNKIALSLTFTMLLFVGFGQSEKFASDIKETLYIHDTASSVASEIVAYNAFKKLADKYPNEWLPGYWTAYIGTQVSRLYGRPDYPKDLKPRTLLEECKTYLDKAISIKGEMSDEERSNFLALEAFIYGFIAVTISDDAERGEMKALEDKTYREAVKYNMRNPLMYVLRGIDLLGRDDYQDIVAGIGLLDYAEQIFNKVENRGLTTYWNKDFIKFWRSRGENKLKGLLDG